MADKEPRRRKKRKDSVKKDDVRSEDPIFSPTRSESKDSDQEVEEEISALIHQPSSFAKFVFVILFSGLVVSMSFIFISLHGAERGEVDIFDDHHSEEQLSLESTDQIDNTSATDYSEDPENWSSTVEVHEEAESWDAEFLPENLRNMLPDIKNILSFNNEEDEVSSDENADIDDGEDLKNEENEEIISQEPEIVTQKTYQDELHTVDEYHKTEDFLEEDIPTDSMNSFDFDHASESEIDEYEEVQSSQIAEEPVVQQASDSYSEMHDSTSETASDQSGSSSEQSTNPHFSEVVPESVTESITEIFTEDSISSSPPDIKMEEVVGNEKESISNEEESVGIINQDSYDTAEYDESDNFVYEKQLITNEEDYVIREQLDQLEPLIDKSAERVLKKCNDILKLHKESPRLHYLKALALDKLAELQRSNSLLEDAIATYQIVLDLKNVPEDLYLLAGKKASDRMRFRGFLGKSLKLLIRISSKYPKNIEIKNLVAVGYLLIGQDIAAKNEFIDVLRLAPDSGFAKVHLGFILKTVDSKYEEAVKLLSEGIASKEEGVIDGRFYFHLGDALHRIGKGDEALKVYDEAVKEGLFLSRYQRSLYNVQGLTGKPWWDPKKTTYAPYFRLLERDWTIIRDEALKLTNDGNSGFLPESEGLQEKGDWKQFELFARGRKIEKNCAKAPKTCALISQIPEAATCKRGQVKFSIMHPSTHVWAHTGPTNCRLRAHLGLIVPTGASIRVANEIRHWEEGKILFFDDSFEHEVWHNGSSPRLVLIIDFWHPDLSPYQKRSLTPI